MVLDNTWDWNEGEEDSSEAITMRRQLRKVLEGRVRTLQEQIGGLTVDDYDEALTWAEATPGNGRALSEAADDLLAPAPPPDLTAGELAELLEAGLPDGDDLGILAEALKLRDAQRWDAVWGYRITQIMHRTMPSLWAATPAQIAALLVALYEYQAGRQFSGRPTATVPHEVFLWGVEVGYDYHRLYGSFGTPGERNIQTAEQMVKWRWIPAMKVAEFEGRTLEEVNEAFESEERLGRKVEGLWYSALNLLQGYEAQERGMAFLRLRIQQQVTGVLRGYLERVRDNHYFTDSGALPETVGAAGLESVR